MDDRRALRARRSTASPSRSRWMRRRSTRSCRTSPPPRAARSRRASSCSRSTPRTATCCTSSSRRCRTSATTSTAGRSRTVRVCCCASSTRSGMPHPTRPLFVRFSAIRLGRGRMGRRGDRDGRALGVRARRRLLRHLQRRPRRAPEASSPGRAIRSASRPHVRRERGVPVSAVGLINDAAQAEQLLAAGDADAVMAGREWLRDPHFALRAAVGARRRRSTTGRSSTCAPAPA